MIVAIWVPKYNIEFDDPCCYPMGLMYISAVLKRDGHAVVVLNNNLYPHSPEVLTYADAVLFTGFEETMPETIMLSTRLRSKGVHTILGGAYATFKTDEALKHFDVVVVGEGEHAFPTALRVRGTINAAPMAMSDIPLPDYAGFGIDEYHRRRDIRYMGVLTARGCPHSCTFCSSVCKFRVRDLRDVRAEVNRYIDTYNVSTIVINDNTLNTSLARLSDFCDMMRPMAIEWTAALRLDNLNEDLVRSARDSGLVYAVVGVESFDQQKLDAMNKSITVREVVAGLELLQKYAVPYTGNVLVSSEEEIDNNMTLIRKYRLYPTAIKKFVGNSVDEAPAAVQNRCRTYAQEHGRHYAA